MSETIAQLFAARVQATPDADALWFHDAGQWQPISWRDYGQRVARVARGLIARGVASADKVALIGANTPAWFAADMAATRMGAVSVPIYATSSGEQICYILNHSEAKLLFMENLEYFARIQPLMDTLSTLEWVVVQGGEVPAGADRVLSLEQLLASGEAVADPVLERFGEAVGPDSLATLIYTSGTTGHPKAVMLTHRNCVTAAKNVHLTIGADAPAGEKSSCSYLPLSHVADRVVNLYSPLLDGRTVYFLRGLDTFAEDVRSIRPTMWLGVPRIWEKLFEGVMARRAGLPEPQRAAFDRALAVGAEYNAQRYARQPIADALAADHARAKEQIIDPLRRSLGLDRVEHTITGGAPTSKEILDFFMSIGIWLQDVYGQTEGYGTTSFATRDAIRFGSTGKPYPLVEVRIAADGEILVKGDNVSPGYYKEPELTAETIRDGWLHSGDLGELDEDGFLWIKGRKKDIIITSGGKNITPTKIEASLMSSPLVEHAVVAGDGRKYLTALLTVNAVEAASLAPDRVQQALADHVQQVNEKLSRVEQIKNHRVLAEPFSIDGGELTPTQKVRRFDVLRKYEKEVESLYQA